MFKELVENGLTVFAENFNSWQEAIRYSCKPLEEKNIVDERYAEAIIECVNQYGPYIVLFPGLAMPHSTLGSDGVNDTAISFMKVEQPVIFDENDAETFQAKVFFTICATDSEKHMENIQKLAELLNNEELVEELYEVKNNQDLFDLGIKYEL